MERQDAVRPSSPKSKTPRGTRRSYNCEEFREDGAWGFDAVGRFFWQISRGVFYPVRLREWEIGRIFLVLVGSGLGSDESVCNCDVVVRADGVEIWRESFAEEGDEAAF
jgi:hypothetical protein